MTSPMNLNSIQTDWATKIVQRIKARGLPIEVAQIAITTVLDETGLQMYANSNNPESLALPHDAVGSDAGSVGLFQQQVGGAVNSTANWGTTAQCMDVIYSTDSFVNALLALSPPYTSLTQWDAAQAVQGSYDPTGGNYRTQNPAAIAIVAQLWNTTKGGTMDMSNVQFGNNNPETLGWPVGVGFVPYTWNGYQFPQGVYQGTEPLWDDLLAAVVPLIVGGIHPGGFSVAGTWGAEVRQNVNSPGTTSFHACGRALDINAPWNGNQQGWQDGIQWGVPSTVAPLARARGFLAGGEWGDAMHFELHLTPAEIATRLAELAAPATPATTATTPTTQNGDTNTMADITPAQMDDIAYRVNHNPLGGKGTPSPAAYAVGTHAISVAMQQALVALSAGMTRVIKADKA